MVLDDDATLWSEPEGERGGRPLLVLLHGYGSYEGDLFGLRHYLPDELVVAALRGPLPTPPGYSWWSSDGMGSENSAAAAESAADVVADWIGMAAASASSVGVLGFSQGARMSLLMLRRRPRLLDYAVVLSGGVFSKSEPGDDELATIQPPVFFGYGTADPIVSPAMFPTTAEWLPRFTTETVRSYPGLGHGVSEQELADIAAFLGDRLSSARRN